MNKLPPHKKTKRLILFKEVIHVCSKNHRKQIQRIFLGLKIWHILTARASHRKLWFNFCSILRPLSVENSLHWTTKDKHDNFFCHVLRSLCTRIFEKASSFTQTKTWFLPRIAQTQIFSFPCEETRRFFALFIDSFASNIKLFSSLIPSLLTSNSFRLWFLRF